LTKINFTSQINSLQLTDSNVDFQKISRRDTPDPTSKKEGAGRERKGRENGRDKRNVVEIRGSSTC